MKYHDVRAELTASVWRIEVEVNTTVRKGDVLMILESMKMEIPVAAPMSGRVAALHAAEGDSVQEGDVLVAIEMDE